MADSVEPSNGESGDQGPHPSSSRGPEPTGFELEDPTQQAGFVRMLLRLGLDYAALNAPGGTAVAVRARPYPAPFRHETLVGFGSVRLDAWVARLAGPAPLVVFLPGTFATKDVDSLRARVAQFPERLGCHVVTMDLRGFGGSRSSQSMAGYHEKRDVEMIVRRFQQELDVTRTVLIGESLGAVVALHAAHRLGPSHADAVVAWSPWADTRWAVQWTSTRPARTESFWHIQPVLAGLLRQVTKNQFSQFLPYLEHVADSCDIRREELFDGTSPRRIVADLEVPALVLHARDDPITPVLHAEVLQQCAGPKVSVDIHPTGSHVLFHRANEAWWWMITRLAVRGALA